MLAIAFLGGLGAGALLARPSASNEVAAPSEPERTTSPDVVPVDGPECGGIAPAATERPRDPRAATFDVDVPSPRGHPGESRRGVRRKVRDEP